MSTTSEQFRDFSDKQREKAADSGAALPDGSFPIMNGGDLKNAIHAIGRAKDPEKAKVHIRARAKALGLEAELPEEWCAMEKMGARSAARLSFASAVALSDEPEMRKVDGVEYVVGKPIHIFPRGDWTAVDGREVEFNAADANSLMSDLKTRHSDVALTFDHETDKARGSEAAGWMPIHAFAFRDDGLWNDEPLWVVSVYNDLIKTGKFRYLSGDALGIGSANKGDAFHPRRLLAGSLVPKPGFVRGLKGISLAADEHAAIESWLAPIPLVQKELFTMKKKMTREELGLPMDAPAEVFASALVKWAEEEAAEPEHKDSMKAGASEGLCAACKAGETCDDPDCADCPECEEKEKEEEKMSAKNETPATPADTEKLVAEKFAALGTELAGKAIAGAREAAEKSVAERFAAEARSREIDGILDGAMKDGRIVAANREVFRETFASNFEHGKKLVEALPKPQTAPGEALVARNTFVVGGSSQQLSREDLKAAFDNPDRDSAKYAVQGKFLTAVARFSSTTGVDPASAMASVLRGENEGLEKEILAGEGKTAEDFTGTHVGQFRASQRQIPVDQDVVDFLKKRTTRGDIPGAVINPEIQRFASITDFQPSARTTLPMALGYFQSEFVGDEALPVFVGGADEKAAWPELFFEKFAAVAAAAGFLGSPTETSLNVTWHTVTLDKYPVRGNIDRRARAASITLPRGIDTIMLENLKSQVGVTKETAQASFLTTNGNYFDSSYYPSVTAWSSAGTPAAYVSLPIEDIYKGMQHVRVGVRAWPDLLLLSPAAAAALRKNQQIIDTVRFTGSKADPGTGVSNQTIAALFAGLFNLTIVVGEAGTASLPSGSPVSDVWGLDAWLLCTGKGQIEAPRMGMTVGAAGSPRVRAFPAEHLGADGADAIVYTDAWQIVSISKKAGYRMVGASAAI